MFAAGCAVCGTPLDPARGAQRSLSRRLRSAFVRRRPSAKTPRPE
jgi:hypothetical protein